MISNRYVLFVPILILGAVVLITCGGGGSGPSSSTVTMTGTIEFPGNSVAYDSLTIGFGDNEALVDSNGSFDIKGTEEIPGLTIAMDVSDSVPVMLGIVCSPGKNMDLELDAHSTALALVFMNPMVCVSDPDEAQIVVDTIESLPEFQTFRNLVEDRMEADPKFLMNDDQELIDAMADVVAAYVTLVPEVVARNYPSASEIVLKGYTATAGGVVVEPATTFAGLSLQHKGGDQFEISNAYGRWAYLVLPTGQKKLLPPNGQMFDFIKDGVPWAPSKTTFNLTPKEVPDTQYVHIYGYGWSSEADNQWDALSDVEKLDCHRVGIATIVLEFAGHILSLYGNVKTGLIDAGALRKYDDARIIQLASFFTGDVVFMAQVVDMTRKHKWWDLIYAVANKVVTKFATDGEYRAFWMKMAGYAMTQATIDRIAKVVITKPVGAIAYGFMIGENLTSVAKTVVGLNSSRFKTSYRIWKEIGDFGNITGGIFEKDGGRPVEGAAIELLGDEHNPINTPHSYTTDAGGGFYFENILIGEKTLNVTKSGYRPASASVIVAKDKTITRNIEIEKVHGYANGKIRNEIFIENGLANTLFNKEINLMIREIGGEGRTESYSVTNGEYRLSMFVGEWWIIAEHEDYKRDSVRVTIEDDTETYANDIIMVPDMMMSGSIDLDLDANGVYEITRNMTFNVLAGSESETAPYYVACPTGPSAKVMRLVGALQPNNEFQIWLNTEEVNSNSSSEPMGTIASTTCKNGGSSAFAIYITNDYKCEDEDGNQATLGFAAPGGPYYGEECLCGVKNYGSVNFYKYEGEELGDVVSGFVLCYVPAWKSCDCEPVDEDGDFIPDKWEVECSLARFTIDFKIHVGTFYKLPGRSPSSTEGSNCIDILDQAMQIIE